MQTGTEYVGECKLLAESYEWGVEGVCDMLGESLASSLENVQRVMANISDNVEFIAYSRELMDIYKSGAAPGHTVA